MVVEYDISNYLISSPKNNPFRCFKHSEFLQKRGGGVKENRYDIFNSHMISWVSHFREQKTKA